MQGLLSQRCRGQGHSHFTSWLQRSGGSPTSTKVPITPSLAANVFLYQPCASLYSVDHFDGAFVLISQMRKQSCKYCAVIKKAIYCAAFWLLPAQNLISIPLPPAFAPACPAALSSSFTLTLTPAWPAMHSQSTSTASDARPKHLHACKSRCSDFSLLKTRSLVSSKS